MENPVASMDEAAQLSEPGRKGGWITFPFIIGTMAGLMLAAGGWISNLIVYLIQEFNIKAISAAKIFNFVNGSIAMFPILGAIIADSYVGSFSVIWFSSLISLLVIMFLIDGRTRIIHSLLLWDGAIKFDSSETAYSLLRSAVCIKLLIPIYAIIGILLLLLTAAIDQLRPESCENNKSNICKFPSHLQLSILYLGLALSCLGNAGTRFTIAPMGADQFKNPKNQGIFFNWYIFTMYTSVVVSSTALVYIEDNISWTMGFTICAAVNMLGLAVFLSGSRFYRLVKPRGSPFKSLACVVIAAFGKRRMTLSLKSEDYCNDLQEDNGTKTPTGFLRFLNRAALRMEGDTTSDGSIINPWKLCTVQQVEDLKTLIRIFPLWSTGLFLCTPLAIQLSLSIIQALKMDRHIGSHFKIPASSMQVFILISTSIWILIIDRILFPLWERLTHRPLTLLQRVGIGHALTIISMGVSAFVESKRLKTAKSGNQTDVLWLVPQLVIAGIGEAFHFPGQIALYYQEFPESLKSTSSAAVAMFIGIAFYISNALIDLIGRASGWLPDDINHGRLDNVYWVCCVLGGLNFGYYLLCASLYKYQILRKDVDAWNGN